MKDLKPDMAIMAGTYAKNKRFKDYDNLYKSVVKKYGNDIKVTTTGHSLGGSQSLYLGHKYDLENYSYNPGVSPFSDNFKKLVENPKSKILLCNKI